MATPTSLPASFTVGQVLTAAQMNDLRGAFRILKVDIDTTTGTESTTSSTFSDTNLSLAITPQATSNKILVIVAGLSFSSASGTEGEYRIVRGATEIAKQAGIAYNSAGNSIESFTIMYLDSPNTTSSTTYKLQQRRSGGAGTITFCQNNSLSSLLLCEVSA